MRTVAGELWRSLAATLPADDRATQAARSTTRHDGCRRVRHGAPLPPRPRRFCAASCKCRFRKRLRGVGDRGSRRLRLIDVPLRSAETVLASPDTDGRQAAVRTALQLLDRVCSLSKAEAMTAISAPLVRAGGVHWLRAIVRALEAAAAVGCGGGDGRCVWGGEGGEKSDDGGCGGGTSSSVGSRTGLKACDADAEPFEAALWHGAAAPLRCSRRVPRSRSRSRRRCCCGWRLACALVPVPTSPLLPPRLPPRRLPSARARWGRSNSFKCYDCSTVSSTARSSTRDQPQVAPTGVGGTHRCATCSACARSSRPRKRGPRRRRPATSAEHGTSFVGEAAARPRRGRRRRPGGHAVDCVEAHEAGWAVMNLMEDGPPTVGVALARHRPRARRRC